MGRIASGNRTIHLTDNVQLETLSNISVHPNAAIYETGKLQFHDAGHDHTGGDQGALIELTSNLVTNSNFDRGISPSGYPDHWLPSGCPDMDFTMYRMDDGGYYGHGSCYISGVPLLEDIPHMYQPLPVPSGALWLPSPSGYDYNSRTITIGCWARGYEVEEDEGVAILLGTYSDSDGYDWEHIPITSIYNPYKRTITVSNTSDTLNICIAPSGEVWVDNVQATMGTRLPLSIPRYNERDLDAWNRLIDTYVNTSPHIIYPGDVLSYDSDYDLSVKHPDMWGISAAGVSIAQSSPVSGAIISTCVFGPTLVNTYGVVTRGDLLYTSYIPSHIGRAISDTYIATFRPTMDDTIPFATALTSSEEAGDSSVVGIILPSFTSNGIEGRVVELQWHASIDIDDMEGMNTYLCTLEGNTVINGYNGIESTSATFILDNDGGGDYLLVMGEGFVSNGKIVSSTGEIVTIVFQYDGTYWWEVTRTYGLETL